MLINKINIYCKEVNSLQIKFNEIYSESQKKFREIWKIMFK